MAELWLVDTAADVVLIYRRSSPEVGGDFDVALELGPEDVLTTPLLPGFSVNLAGLFDR